MSAEFVTRRTLDQKMDWILSSPKDEGDIETLCIRPNEGERDYVQSMQLNKEEGVVGDRWIRKTWMHLEDGSPDPRLQVCVLSSRVLATVRTDTSMMYPGDNIVADLDLSEANLPVGQRLQIGSAVIEVSDVFNTACPKWLARYGADSIVWINLHDHKPLRLRGVLAKVVVAGEVKITDTINKISW
jgi:MOSC domain-containing protein YiiM